MDQDDYEWELSKENVQPLREGRSISFLTAALHSDQEDHSLKEQQNNFELELRTYSGDDPLNVWDRYIKWTEQSYPRGGHDGQQITLIERCLREFQQNEKYLNDPRFIRLWIKFACYADDPVEVYKYMFDNGIGVKVAYLYTEWAIAVERKGDIKSADRVYNTGLKHLAEPKDILAQKHQLFQNRVAQGISRQIAESQNLGMDFGETEEKRTTLGRLKTTGHSVGSTRTGNVIIGPAGSLKDSRGPVKKQVPTKGIPIFCDRQSSSDPPLTQTYEWQSLPVKHIDNQENDRKPGVWTNAKVKQKHGTLPSVSQACPFEIHVDQEVANQPIVTPRKTTVFGHTQPLSCHKASKTDALSSLRQQESKEPCNEIVMYQKDKIYNGLSEFSFEELRAIKYWKRKKLEREGEAQSLQLEGESKNIEESTTATEERLAREEAMISPMIGLSMNKSGILSSSLAMSASSSTNNNTRTPTNEMLLNHFQTSRSSLENVSETSTSMPVLNDLSVQSYYKTISSSSDKNVNEIVNVSLAMSKKLVIEEARGHTPDNFVSKKKFTAPSPTVCTKEALQCVMGMFSAPLDNGIQTSFLEHGNSTLPMASMNQPVGTRRSLEIFEDEGSVPPVKRQNLKLAAKKPLAERAPLASVRRGPHIYCDDEAEIERVPAPAKVFSSTLKGLQIYQDDQLDTGNIVTAPLKQFSSNTNGFNIFQDDQLDTESIQPDDIATKSVRRGLAFTGREDCEMVEVEKTMGREFTIMGQALSDVTLAPLEAFSLYAKIASTPRDGPHSPLEWETSLHVPTTMSVSLATDSAADSLHKEKEGSFNMSSKILSPIIEGGGSASSEESLPQSQATSIICSDTVETHCARLASDQGQCEDDDTQNGRKLPSLCVQQPTHDEAQGDVLKDLPVIAKGNKLEKASLDSSCKHYIDTMTYHHLDDSEDDQSMSVLLDPRDPFDKDTIDLILKTLDPPLSSFPNVISFKEPAPEVDVNPILMKAGVYVSRLLGEGGFAKVYEVTDINDSGEDTMTTDLDRCCQSKAMKVQSPPCYWEFYVNCELRKRLSQLNTFIDVRPSIMEVYKACFFTDSSMLLMNYAQNGSLLNLVNKYRNIPRLLSEVEPFAVLLTIHLLHMFEQIHKCDIIHGDVKPDNFLLLELPELKESKNPEEVLGRKLKMLQLIDFGQTIDMKQFHQGTTFTAKVVTSDFQCIEMRIGRPWTYQTDLFGIAGTIHVALSGSYMHVYQEQGVWKTTCNFVRKWNVPLWKNLFQVLLNVPSCRQQPDLAELRKPFETYFMEKLKDYTKWLILMRKELDH